MGIGGMKMGKGSADVLSTGADLGNSCKWSLYFM